MRPLFQFVRDFLQREEGPTTVEYAVLVALIITVCVSAVQALGANVKTSVTNSNNACFGAGS
jgi:pilus assembly protein Flp/PilA